MHFKALAVDYDGTIAQHGEVPATTVAALQKVQGQSGKLILVTGRVLEELCTVFPQVASFNSVVAENGGLLCNPSTRQVTLLAEPPLPQFIQELQRRKVEPLGVGRVIVATWKPHEIAVLEVIRDLGLDLQVIFNKDAVMVLPSSVNKATGLAAALNNLEIEPHQVVGAGDAENDLAFLAMCGCAAAVQNALPMVKQRATLVTTGDHGRGVEELIEMMLADDPRLGP